MIPKKYKRKISEVQEKKYDGKEKRNYRRVEEKKDRKGKA